MIRPGTRSTWSRPECKHRRYRTTRRLLRQHRQLQTGKGAGEDSYNGMLDCFRKIIRNEG